MPTSERLAPEGQKKLLALDGGGIRGIITLEFLSRMESLLRERLGAGDDFVLADYFDYVAGTSTGAIISTCIAMGMSVAEIQSFYSESGAAMFDKASLLKRFTNYKYEDRELAKTRTRSLPPPRYRMSRCHSRITSSSYFAHQPGGTVRPYRFGPS